MVDEYCKLPENKMLLSFVTEVWQLGYEEEPDYNKLKFMLTKILIDKGEVPKMNLLDEQQINEVVAVERDDLFDDMGKLIIANEHLNIAIKKKKKKA